MNRPRQQCRGFFVFVGWVLTQHGGCEPKAGSWTEVQPTVPSRACRSWFQPDMGRKSKAQSWIKIQPTMFP